MNITKKQWMMIGVVIALIAIWYFFLRKKPTESGYNTRSACQKLGCTGYNNGTCTGCRFRGVTTNTSTAGGGS
jgi:hypothetical protein